MDRRPEKSRRKIYTVAQSDRERSVYMEEKKRLKKENTRQSKYRSQHSFSCFFSPPFARNGTGRGPAQTSDDVPVLSIYSSSLFDDFLSTISIGEISREGAVRRRSVGAGSCRGQVAKEEQLVRRRARPKCKLADDMTCSSHGLCGGIYIGSYASLIFRVQTSSVCICSVWLRIKSAVSSSYIIILAPRQFPRSSSNHHDRIQCITKTLNGAHQRDMLRNYSAAIASQRKLGPRPFVLFYYSQDLFGSRVHDPFFLYIPIHSAAVECCGENVFASYFWGFLSLRLCLAVRSASANGRHFPSVLFSFLRWQL